MLFWGKKHTEAQYGALVDISSGSIGIAILLSDPQKALPQIVYVERLPFRQTAHHTIRDILDTRRVREALLSASLTLSSDGMAVLQRSDEHARISKIFVTCSAPWAQTIARNAQYNTDTNFKVTKSIISDLVTSVEQDVLTHSTNSQDEEIPYRIVERATVDITLNEYAVTRPFGLIGKSLTLSHVMGLIPQDLLSAIEEVHEKVFPQAIVQAHTSMLVAYCVLQDIFPNTHTACVIDVTGESTEFGLIEKNLLIANSYVPSGINTILRATAKSHGIPLADLERQLSEYTPEVCNDSTPLGSALVAYRTDVVNEIKRIQEHRSFPKEIILIVSPQFQESFTRIITDAFGEIRDENHSIALLPDITTSSLMPAESSDPYIALSARFFHKLHGCTDISDV